MKLVEDHSACGGCGSSDCGSADKKKHHNHGSGQGGMALGYDGEEDWLSFYNYLFNLIHRSQLKTGITGTFIKDAKTNISTNATAQFRGQFNFITIYDQDHKPRKLHDPHQPQITDNPTRVVAHISHIEVEYKNPDKSAPFIEARGFKHDLHSSNIPRPTENTTEANRPIVNESHAYLAERAEAAFAMVYMAKAKGMTSVNFMDTSDPVDRAMLIQACKHLDVSYGAETLMSSSVGTAIDPMPKDFPMAQAFSGKVNQFLQERGLEMTEENRLEMLCERVLMLYVKHPDKEPNDRLGHFSCGHDPKYNLKDHPHV